MLFAVTSLMVLANSWEEEEFLGEDDSILSRYRYRSTWLLMVISGVFCTLGECGRAESWSCATSSYTLISSVSRGQPHAGSMAFVRSVHEEPPMKPLFPHLYHLQSDELLGSWLFLLATLPVIPYSLIYIAASHEDIVYLGALGVALVLVAGTYLFVRACYPTENNKVRMPLVASASMVTDRSYPACVAAQHEVHPAHRQVRVLVLLQRAVAAEEHRQRLVGGHVVHLLGHLLRLLRVRHPAGRGRE